MLTRNYNYAVFGGQSYDPDAQAIFNVWPATTPAATKIAANDAIVALKALGAWDAFDLLYPFGSARQAGANLPERAAASLVNWKSPGTFDCIPVNAPIYDDADGTWRGDATSARLRTQWTPSTDAVSYALDDASLWLWSLTDKALSAGDAGNISVSPRCEIYTKYGDGKAYTAINSTSELGVDVANSLGLYVGQRRGATDIRLFKDGAQIGAGSTASTGLPTQEQWICAINNASFSDRKIVLAGWGSAQVGKEAAIYSIFQTLFQATGAIP